MKISSFFFLLLMLSSFRLFGQDDVDENKFTVALSVYSGPSQLAGSNKFMPSFKKVFNYHGHSSLMFSIMEEKLSEKVIEGMENITYVEYLMKTTFVSNYNDVKFTSTRIVKGKGPDLGEAMMDAFSKFANDKKNMPAQLDSVNVLLQKLFVDNCETEIAKKFTDDKLYIQSANLKYIPKKSPCYEQAQQMIIEIQEKQELINCKESIRKMNLAVESKTYDANRIVARLIEIPAKSPCASDAMILAKKIGQDKAAKISTSSKEKLEIYINNYGK